MRIGSLFSGVGLLELGLERAGLGRTVWQVEKDEWCRKVLAKHWPNATRFDDVCTATSLPSVDVLCGGFPCQPFSLAGKRLAQADERHLWPEYARIIREVEPKAIVSENVPGLQSSGLRDVLADLAGLGFDVEWAHLRACDLGAPHIRRRVFIVATHPDRLRLREQPRGWLQRAFESSAQTVARRPVEVGDATDADLQQPSPRDLRHREPEAGNVLTDADCMRRLEQAISLATQRGWAEHCGWTLDPASLVDDGRTRRLVRGTLGRQRKALGNAVVVPCAELVGRALLEAIG